jgi:FlaA1/EpsC-like NDP-sugar epimerase
MDELAALATGRSEDLFAEDLRRNADKIRLQLEGRRVLVLGGAGSIGASTVSLLSQFDPACLHVVDHNENALAELVRDLRSRSGGLRVHEFRAVPIDFLSPIMLRFLKTERPYDWVFNFAAMKHVRSDKDVCSLLQMFNTNLLKPMACWRWLEDTGSPPYYFSVSTDKAADPVNLMGASKRIMEHVMFCEQGLMSSAKRATSSRFANVAFSNGSLLESFVRRFEKRQPLAAPRDTSRYFISQQEAGQICVLAAACGPDGHIMIPSLNPREDSKPLDEIAVAFLRHRGLEPQFYQDEETARASVSRDLLANRYPLLLTNLDTEGEKPSETFADQEEQIVDIGMSRILAVRYRPIPPESLHNFLRVIADFISSPNQPVEKRSIIEAVARVIPEFNYLERPLTLDQRM